MILFDTETTGLVLPLLTPIAKQPEIIELAALVLDDTTLKETACYSALVRPKILPLPPKIIEITGITTEMLTEADVFPFTQHFLPLVNIFFGQRLMVAHNLAFDRDLLHFELLRLGKTCQFPWPPTHLCTVELTKHLEGHRLSQDRLYAKMVGVARDPGAHRALVDVRDLATIVRAMRKENLI